MNDPHLLRKKIGRLWTEAASFANGVHSFASRLRGPDAAPTVYELKRSATQFQMGVAEGCNCGDAAELRDALRRARVKAAYLADCLSLCRHFDGVKAAEVDGLLNDFQPVVAQIDALICVVSGGDDRRD